jgi:succinate dehydrogenase flavin-adding protein (antitoxin of CptAB toxin-antitoxin module)
MPSDPIFPDDRFDYINSEEKDEIRAILSETHPEMISFLSKTQSRPDQANKTSAVAAPAR